jgi:hypothetical protein
MVIYPADESSRLFGDLCPVGIDFKVVPEDQLELCAHQSGLDKSIKISETYLVGPTGRNKQPGPLLSQKNTSLLAPAVGVRDEVNNITFVLGLDSINHVRK